MFNLVVTFLIKNYYLYLCRQYFLNISYAKKHTSVVTVEI